MMKLKARVPLPLGQHDVVSQETARTLIGQTFPATGENHEKIGNAIITDVEWRDQNDILLHIEMEI